MSWVVLCAYVAAAAAGESVFVGIVPLAPELEARAERAAVALGHALEKHGVVDLGAPPLPDTTEEQAAALTELLGLARASYLEADFATSLSRADQAITRFEGGGAFRAGQAWSSYEQVLVLRALVLRKLGKEADSDEALAHLATLRPQAVPDPAITPPRVVQRHEQVLAQLREGARTQLEVLSSPPGAEVIVDGRSIGRAPVIVRDLFPGTHFVSLTALGAHVEQRVLATGANVRVEAVVGDPRSEVAQALRSTLSMHASKEELLHDARQVSDDVFLGVIAPLGNDAVLVLARARGGAWQTAGAVVERTGPLNDRPADLVAALLAGRTGWLDSGPGNPEQFLLRGGGAGTQHAGETPPAVEPDPDDGGWLLLGLGVGLVAVAAGAVAVGVFVADQSAQLVGVTVDASKL